MEVKDVIDTVKDSKDDVKNLVLERLKYPIINLYLFFLIVCNWDVIIIMFLYEGSSLNRVAEIKSLLDSSNFWLFFNTRLLLPLLYALISCFIYPYISFLIEKVLYDTNEKRIEKHYDLKEKIADREKEVLEKITGNESKRNMLKHIEDLKTLVKEGESKILELEQGYKKDLNSKENLIKNYKRELDDLTSWKDGLSISNDKYKRLFFKGLTKYMRDQLSVKENLNDLVFFNFLEELNRYLISLSNNEFLPSREIILEKISLALNEHLPFNEIEIELYSNKIFKILNENTFFISNGNDFIIDDVLIEYDEYVALIKSDYLSTKGIF